MGQHEMEFEGEQAGHTRGHVIILVGCVHTERDALYATRTHSHTLTHTRLVTTPLGGYEGETATGRREQTGVWGEKIVF